MKKVVFFLLVSLVIGFNTLSAKDKADQEMSVQVTASTTELSGVIFDKLTNETLAGVVVTANGQKVYTDLDGNFTVKNLLTGVCELKISMISYEDQVVKVDVAKLKNLKIQLSQR